MIEDKVYPKKKVKYYMTQFDKAGEKWIPRRIGSISADTDGKISFIINRSDITFKAGAKGEFATGVLSTPHEAEERAKQMLTKQGYKVTPPK